MLSELCKELNNWFPVAMYFGEYTISGGSISGTGIDDLQDGQYFRIAGSIFNDGVYKYPVTELKDETFSGAVWAMAVPKGVLDLAEDIQAWKEKYEALDSPAMSPFQSESFGGYSYSKGSHSSGSGSDGDVATWEKAFSKRLRLWRKIRP